MPQIDKITFLTTIYWVFVSYFFLYLDLSVTYLYKFLTYLKFRYQRLCSYYREIQINTLWTRVFSFGAAYHNRILLIVSNPENPRTLTIKLWEFYNIWPWHQWCTSLGLLIASYWYAGTLYNRWLSDRGGWLSWKMRVWLIVSDLSLNLSLGVYYMDHRDTFMGQFMLKCPVAISPIIFLLELLCVYLYFRYGSKDKKKSYDKSKK